MAVTKKISDLVVARRETLTVTERRLAQLVCDDPEAVAFGNTASVARAAETSAPSVVRFAVKLGFQGFVDLQAAIRRDLSGRISSSYRRSREPAAFSDLNAWIEVETLNARETLTEAWPKVGLAAAWLADPGRRIFVLAAEQWAGPGRTFADFLQLIRGRVQRLSGSPFRVTSQLSVARPGDVIVTMDAQRNERWVMETHAMARRLGLQAIAVTDSPLNPIAVDSDLHFRVWRATCGLFESKTGVSALLNLLLDATGRAMGEDAVRRLADTEGLWIASEALKGELAP